MSINANTADSMRDQVILANQEFYKQIAAKYDHYEYCASDEFFQQAIEADLLHIEQAFSRRRSLAPVRCLDCGGGTGNITLKMLKRGWHVTVVDVSADMLSILKAKIETAGQSATFVNDSVENFFSQSHEAFDVISFSSVLHHLYSPLAVVKSAAQRISRGGFFYSIFDPVPPASKFMAACFSGLDTLLAKLIYDRKDFLPGLKRRLQKLKTPQNSAHGRAVVSAGDLAEYHAHAGINEKLLVHTLERQGFIVDLQRYPVGRTKLMRWANSHLRALLNFRILAQRAPDL
jgi:2-polyprenyl-3-methyl-5-hydroxy-6-metoxy-1,4-benzoquinol methylase